MHPPHPAPLQLFATLDPTTRRVELPGGKGILFTDTVGFIQKLPTQARLSCSLSSCRCFWLPPPLQCGAS